MSSAAKLRTPGRVIAVAASAALVMTSFGPAAFAWDPVTTETAPNQANIASIGLIDMDRATDGTQGATAVAPTKNNQAVGAVRFVVPGTWKANDTLTFTLNANSTFAVKPTVDIDEKAYDESTHVALTSGDDTPGNVEDGLETAYDGTGTPVAPKFTTALTRANVLTVTFTNSSSTNAKDAKFIGAINDAKINTDGASGDVTLTMAGVGGGPLQIGDATNSQDKTVVAYVVNAALSAQNTAIVADDTAQFVGPFTVTGSFSGSDPLKIEVAGTGDDATVGGTVRAQEYDASGNLTRTSTATVANAGGTGTVTVTPQATTTKIVLSGMTAKVGTKATRVTYSLTADGAGGTPPPAALGSGSDLTQTDIDGQSLGGSVITVATAAPTSQRVGGVDRYDTAVRKAATSVSKGEGTLTNPIGEANTVVIASGENFADALSAGYLTAVEKAQLVLTMKGQLPTSTENFLKTFGAKKVYIIGGENAISANVEAKLRSLTAWDIQSAAQASGGTTKTISYTANFDAGTEEVAGTATAGVPTIAPTAGKNLATQPVVNQVLAVQLNRTTGAVAIDTDNTLAAGGVPTIALKSGSSGKSSGTETAVVTWQGQTFDVVFPAAAITVADQVAKFNVGSFSTQETVTPTTTVDAGATAKGTDRRIVNTGGTLEVNRLSGANRFVTNRNVNEYALRASGTSIGTTVPEFGKPSKRTAIIANGLTPWDALASGPLIGSYDADGAPLAQNRPKPIILTAGSTLEGQAKGQMGSLGVQHALLVGGSSVIPDAAAKELNDGFSVTSTRLAGANRWETGKAVVDFLFKNNAGSARNPNPGLGFPNTDAYLVNGGVVNGRANPDKWADALALGPAAAKWSQPIVLTASESLPEASKNAIVGNKARIENVIPVGGTDVVSNAVADQASAAAK